MRTMVQDVRYAIRMFARRPGFAAAAVAAIALGIASATAVFSIVNAVLLNSLPAAHLDRLALLWQQDLPSGRDRITLSAAEYREYANGRTSFDALAAMRGVSLSVSAADTASAVEGIQVTPNFLETLGIAPVHGRGFSQDIEASRQEALVTYEYWERALGGDANVLGRTLVIRAGFTGAGPRTDPIDGSYLVIGFLPRGLKLPYRAADVWIPLDLDRQPAASTGLLVFTRRQPDVTLAQAQFEVEATAARLLEGSPERSRTLSAWLVSLRTEDVGDIRPTLILLQAAVGLLILIVCANIGNMLLSRLTERHRELAVRRALGASGSRLLRQLLTEAVLLAAAGAVVGVLLALWMTQGLARIGPSTIPRLQDVHVDGRALAAAFGTALLMSVLFGLVPALRSARVPIGQGLAQRTGNTAAVGRLRETLVTAEVALAFIVLVGAALVFTSARALETATIGYEPGNVLTFRVSLPAAQYAEPDTRAAFFRTLLERLHLLPGVTGVGAVSILPQMDTNRSIDFSVDGAAASADARYNARFRIASPGYFQALGIRVLRGREFQDADVATGAVVVSRSMAERFWPNVDPVGSRVRLALTGTPTSLPVVGVVDDVRQWVNTPAEPTVYWANLTQTGFAFAVRTATDPDSSRQAIVRAIEQIDPHQPVFDMQSMQERLARSQQLTYARFRTFVMSAFGVAALVLAGLGIYGVVRYMVLQRAQEFGIRTALGASPRHLIAMVLSQSLRSVLIGLALGLLASLALERMLRSILYEAAGSERFILAAVAAVLGAIAIAAALGPARWAGRADPVRALRGQ